MTPYGKTAQAAIAAVSRLAEVYDAENPVKLSSAQIAEARDLSQPLVGKVLTMLSQTRLINGSPGPGGGYLLAKPPGEITLYEVAAPFDRLEDTLVCPFGPNWCGHQPHCPLHDKLVALRDEVTTFLQANTFAAFQPAAKRKSAKRP